MAYEIYRKFEEYPNAFQIALFLGDLEVCTLLRLHILFLEPSVSYYIIVNSVCVVCARAGMPVLCEEQNEELCF